MGSLLELDDYSANIPYRVWPESLGDIECDAPGSIEGGFDLGIGLSQCGPVYDGVRMNWHGDPCGWVIPFDVLERWYLANKAVRDEAGLK